MNSFSSSLQIIFSFLPLLICFSFFLIALSPSSLLFLLSTPTSFFTSLHLSPFIIGCSPLTSFILQSFQHFSFCPPFLPLDDYNTWDMSDSKWDWKRKHKEKQTGATPDWHIIEGEEEKKEHALRPPEEIEVSTGWILLLPFTAKTICGQNMECSGAICRQNCWSGPNVFPWQLICMRDAGSPPRSPWQQAVGFCQSRLCAQGQCGLRDTINK